MLPDRPAPRSHDRRSWLWAAAFYAVAVLYLAWPISRHPATMLADFSASREPLARWTGLDRDLATWVLGWTARASVDQPSRLFQANIFHPAPDTLASSENLLGLLPVSAPAFLLSGNPVLTHNVVVMTLVWMLALLTFVALRGWTGSAPAGLLGGALAAFAPMVVANWSNVISGTAVHLFPLVLALLWRAAERPGVTILAALAAVIALQVLSGLYVAYQLAVVVGAFLPGVLLQARSGGRRPWPVLGAVALGFLVLVPVSVPYLRVRASGVLPDPATARMIVATLAPSWGAEWRTVLDNVGWAGLALALAGVVAPVVTPYLRGSLLLAACLTFVLGRGPDVPLLPGTSLPGIYELAMRIVPGFASMRASGRFLIATILLLAMLAGLGAAAALRALRARTGARGARVGAVALVLAAVVVVVQRGAAPHLPAVRVPAAPGDWDVYAWLRDHGDAGALVEIPAMVSPMDGRDIVATGGYLLGASIHRLPLLNGYSGHSPPSATLLLSLAQRLPDARALEELCFATRLRWIAVHPAALGEQASAWRDAERDLPVERVGEFPGPVWLYRVKHSCGAAEDQLRTQLAGVGRDRTLHGNALAPLAPEARRGSIRIEKDTSAFAASLHSWLPIEVTNGGTQVWPGAAMGFPGTVLVQTRFRDVATGELKQPATAVPLGVDLKPGESAHVLVGVQAPGAGEYDLEIGLLQSGGGWFRDEPGGGAGTSVRTRVVAFGAPARGKSPG